MNRKEEIRRAADEWGAKTEAECIRYPEFLNVMSGNKIGFCDGALWADSHQWISVNERLPEYGTKVLILRPNCGWRHEDYIQEARRVAPEDTDPLYAYDRFGFENVPSSPTHWMSIPAIPKK